MHERLILKDLPLPGLKLIQRNPISDQRGSLQRLYCQDIFLKDNIVDSIQQINLTHTTAAGIIRGMHFQYSPHAEIKIVSCIKGKVFDVAVDLRQDSPTFLKWYAEILSPELNNSLLIPKGFAHGFQTLTENCELLYLHTASYRPEAEGGLNPMDQRINIAWPLELVDMSQRDKSHPFLTSDFKGLT